MKKILLLLVFAAMTIAIHAQGDTVGYKSIFGDESTVWSGMLSGWDSGWDRNYSLRTSGDTIINSTKYIKIECIPIDIFGGEHREYAGDFLLREDTLTGKVWCRYTESVLTTHNVHTDDIDTDLLIMDMGLKIGDSVILWYRLHTGKFYVISVEYLDSVKQIILEDELYDEDKDWHKITFIEGVGTTQLIGCLPFYYANNILTCCRKDGSLVYHNSECIGYPYYRELAEDQCFFLRSGIDNHYEFNGFSISPNPCRSNIILQGENLQHADIYDINGRYVQTIQDFSTTVNIGTLSPGCYILKIYANGITTNHKLVKLSD